MSGSRMYMAFNIVSALCGQRRMKRRALPQEMQDTLKLSSQTAAIVTFMERWNTQMLPLGKRLADLLREYLEGGVAAAMSAEAFDSSDDKQPHEAQNECSISLGR